ncbi:MAG: UDP-N-acetylmuramoyl-tripeptide--D-alanyl-D-alanine ligase [Phycisphaerales bacterium]|nr:UDP-N-acetylmuramoyl-tripeptide--D-alanyl-D-alanine ligase [Planctomycetota bacterium]MBL6997602.1 UDP-N-acetylmuramoyl-tripeptide--D-alanyl-D-alanine ligase [Phycisphaerales bacterium]
MTFSTEQLARYVQGSLQGDSNVQCNGASIDSRSCEIGNVFFALEGEHADGHQFVKQAFEAGCAVVVAEREIEVGAPVVLVENARSALFELALQRRKELSVTKVISVTGSVGKTTTKNLIASLLGEHVVASKKSFNNDLGVPLTILDAEHAEFLVAEVGANDVGEIEPLANLVQPDIAVLTAIGLAHLEGFGDYETVLTEKVKLLQALPPDGVAIVPESIDLSSFSIAASICTVGTSPEADVQIEIGTNDLGYATLRIGNDEVVLSILGKHNAMNAALALVAVGYARPECQRRHLMQEISCVEAPSGRLQIHECNGITFLDDSYNANPTSMQSALELFGEILCGRKVLILGDMLELGEHSYAEHQTLSASINTAQADVVILVGDYMKIPSRSVASIYEPEASAEAMVRIAGLLDVGDTVLIKGSRGLKLERIIEMKRQTKVSSS